MPANNKTKALYGNESKVNRDDRNKRPVINILPAQDIKTPWQDYASGKSKVRPKS